MGYSEQTENRIRKATEKAKKKREEEYRLSQVVTGEDGDYSPTPTYDEVVDNIRNPDPYKEEGPSPFLDVDEEAAIRDRIGGKAVDKADAEWQAAFDEKQERHGAGEQFPEEIDQNGRLRLDSEIEEIKWGNLKRQGKLREHNERFGGVPEHLLAEEAETQGTSGVGGALGEQGVAGSAMDGFKSEAESSDGFSDEKPQPTFEEEQIMNRPILSDAEVRELGDLPSPSFESEEKEQGQPGTQFLGDRERWDKADARREEEENEAALQKLRDDPTVLTTPEHDAEMESLRERVKEERFAEVGEAASEDSEFTQESHPGGGGVAPIAKNADHYTNGIVLADGTRMYRHPDGSWKRKPASKEVVDSAVRELLRSEKTDLTDEDKQRFSDEADAVLAEESALVGLDDLEAVETTEDASAVATDPDVSDTVRTAAEEQISGFTQQQRLDKQTRGNEFLAGKVDRQNRLGAGESIAEQKAADNPVWQQALVDKAAREAAEPDIHERDTATAAEMAARFEARGTKGGYKRSAVEPPMINKDGKELGSLYYDPMLSEVKDIVVDGVIIDREVVDLEGVREGEDAKKKQEGMVWVVPSEGGFRTGDQRFAGEGPGRWVRPDQATLMDKGKEDRRIEKDRRQAVLDKKNRTPQEVAEDNLREAREHDIKMQQIEFNQDDDDAIVEKQLKIKNLQELLAGEGLSIDERNMYEQQLNALLAGGEVGAGAGAGGGPDGADDERPAGEHSADLLAADVGLHTAITGLPWAATTGTNDHGDTGVMLQKIKELLDGGSIKESNKTAAFGYINSLIQDFMRTSIEDHKGGTGPAENSNWWFSNDIPGYNENQLYLFFHAIQAGEWPPGYPK